MQRQYNVTHGAASYYIVNRPLDSITAQKGESVCYLVT